MKIEINNTIYKCAVFSVFIRKVLKKALTLLKKDISLSVAVVDAKTIRLLNKKYLNINKVTDVLAFNYKTKNLEREAISFFGEIIICWSVIERQAGSYREDTYKILARVLIHALLHLFGYDHRNKKERQIMERKVDIILKKISNI